MFTPCKYCKEPHIFYCCHRGIQLLKYMKNRSTLETRSRFELQWLMNHFKYALTNNKPKMIDKLLTVDISNRLQECPICLEDMNIDNISITSCRHAFCNNCILKHTQENNYCPICREPCNLMFILEIIAKEKSIDIYKNIYPNETAKQVYYTQQFVGGAIHQNGYLLDEEDIEAMNYHHALINERNITCAIFITTIVVHLCYIIPLLCVIHI